MKKIFMILSLLTVFIYKLTATAPAPATATAPAPATAPATSPDTIKISNDLYLLKLNENCYVHVSYFTDSTYGRFTSNGMIVTDNGDAALFDTPMSDSVTIDLLNYIKDELKLKIQFFIPNHFHDDCTGGIEFLDSTITIISTEKTLEISLQKNITPALIAFKKDYILTIGKVKVELFYPGEAHSPDNMVAYIPEYKILFGGCMMKSLESKTKGNIADANLKTWPKTIKKVKKKFGDAEIVIPGHGQIGNTDIFKHTIKIITIKK